MAPFVGLTGGLGAGKSEALRLLDELGAATLSTDVVVHELLGTTELCERVAGRLGSELVVDGVLDRARIAARVFADDEARAWLEGELWPRVGMRVAEWRAQLGNDRLGVVEVPLLFESGMEAVFDATIAVVADEDVRAARAGTRTHAALEDRERRQLRQSEKAQRADFVVRNDGTIDELRESLSRVLAKLDRSPR
jgi:dephospho-CoA kinase